jgi:RNA recognition motif-containing protein
VKKLYIGNLPYGFTETDLRALLSKFGTIESATIIKDRYTATSKGFGFVELDNEGAKKSITELNGKEIDGRKLVVNEARPMERNDRNDRSFKKY